MNFVKDLLYVSILTVCLFCPFPLASQVPSIVKINTCVKMKYVSEYYIDQIAVYPCYRSNSDSTLTLELSSGGWVFGNYLSVQTPCMDVPFATDLISSQINANINEVSSFNNVCGSDFKIIDLSPIPIPLLDAISSSILCVLLLLLARLLFPETI